MQCGGPYVNRIHAMHHLPCKEKLRCGGLVQPGAEMASGGSICSPLAAIGRPAKRWKWALQQRGWRTRDDGQKPKQEMSRERECFLPQRTIGQWIRSPVISVYGDKVLKTWSQLVPADQAGS